MLSYFDLRRGVQFIFEGQPWEVLEFHQMGKAQDVVVAKTKIKNLINGKVLQKNFHQGDMFEEAEIQKMKANFIYSHRGKFIFGKLDEPGKRIEFTEENLGEITKFLKPNQEVETIIFNDQVISISLPVKVALKVIEAPPGIKGDTAQGGTKTVVLETGATIQTPLFVEAGDIIEVNTETHEYVRRLRDTT